MTAPAGSKLYRRAATLNFALRLLGFAEISLAEGIIIFLLISSSVGLWLQTHTGICGGQMQCFD